MKTVLCLLLALILLTSCNPKPVRNIPTAEAYAMYGHALNMPFYAFQELRQNPLKWFDSIPDSKLRTIGKPENNRLEAHPGEIFVFQIGIWALKDDVSDVHIEFSDLKGRDGNSVSSSRMTCYNTGGIDYKGNPFTKRVDIKGGRVQSMWIGIDLDSIPGGSYKGSLSVISAGHKQNIPLILRVSGDPVLHQGYDEGSRLSRLNWLNSTAGEDENVTKGFLPVSLTGNTISILGRSVEISENGLPASILSFFGPSNQSLIEKGTPVLDGPFRFVIEKKDGSIEKLESEKIDFIQKTPSKVIWTVRSSTPGFELELRGQMEFDGFIDYSLKLTGKGKTEVKDIRLEIPIEKKMADYMMGLGREGGVRPDEWKWRWDLSKNQDMVWIGAVNGGLRLKLKAENYVRPLINVYYKFGPLRLPPSWGNNGKGGVDIKEKNGTILLNAYSGERSISPGEVLDYNFELLVTPFRVIDRHIKFSDRYYHGGGTNASVKIDSAKKYGSNIINIHHAEDIYPFINYPYLDANINELNELVNRVHNENMRLKLYYTTREFTKNLPEFWAFNSLNGEIVYPGPGNSSTTAINPDGPREWYIKNLRENYIPAWYNEIKEGKFKGDTDLSVVSTPDSRLNNFYVAGLEWMVRNIGIDGVYIDDSALERYTLMRARKIIDRYRPEGRMDLHSWNHFNEWAGFASCLNLYMDLLPYFDLVWIGEGRDYNRAPDHWLIEVSGIPFGLPGQMLEGGGNPWRGMVYGITNRPGWIGNPPTWLWKFWDNYRFENKIMIGYWDTECPVKTSNQLIKASVYKDDNEAIIAVANWSDKKQTTALNVLWTKLGIKPEAVDIIIPEIRGFQSEQNHVELSNMVIPGKEGFLVVLRKKAE